MPLTPARRLEVLRGLAKYHDQAPECVEALSDAIKAVEPVGDAKICTWTGDEPCPCPTGPHNTDTAERILALEAAIHHHRSEASLQADTMRSLQERVEALEDGIREIEIAVSSDEDEPDSVLTRIGRLARSMLHPHASHCNEEHGGACPPGDRPDAE